VQSRKNIMEYSFNPRDSAEQWGNLTGLTEGDTVCLYPRPDFDPGF
jgi:hypothetical protein